MTDRQDGAIGAALCFLAAGIVLGDHWLLSLSLVPLSLFCYDALTTVPRGSFAIERRIDPVRPIPGDRATVTLRLHNESDRALPDVRLADGVPESVPVVDGSPRGCVSLRAGEEISIEYEIRVGPGIHEYDDPIVTLRNLGGCLSRTRRVDANGDDRVEPAVASIDRSDRAKERSIGGPGAVDSGGDGVEFYATREYRSGDPRNRVDWRRFAKTRELATVEYRESGGSSALIVVDGRSTGAAAPTDRGPTGRSLALYAGARLVEWTDRNDSVGVAAIADGGTVHWAPPGATGDKNGLSVLRTIASDGDATGAGTTVERGLNAPDDLADWLAGTVTSNTNITVVSPLYDDPPVELAARLTEHGRDVTVLTPTASTVAHDESAVNGDRAAVAAETPGASYERLCREDRIDRLGATGTRVVDWSPEQLLAATIGPAGVSGP